MFRWSVWAGLILGVAAAPADGPELPVPRAVVKPAPPAEPPPEPRPAETPRPGGSRGRDVTELQRETERLRQERAALQEERHRAVRQVDEGGDAAAAEMTRLRLRLAELLLKVGGPRAPRPAVEPLPTPPRPVEPALPPPKGAEGPDKPPPPAEPDVPPVTGPGKIIDPLALAESLFRAGDYEAALGTYRLLNPATLSDEERVAVQYLTACCLRRLGKLTEAATLFREVANAGEDPVLAECAQWQLGAVNWRRDLETRLHELRKRRQALEVKP